MKMSMGKFLIGLVLLVFMLPLAAEDYVGAGHTAYSPMTCDSGCSVAFEADRSVSTVNLGRRSDGPLSAGIETSFGDGYVGIAVSARAWGDGQFSVRPGLMLGDMDAESSAYNGPNTFLYGSNRFAMAFVEANYNGFFVSAGYLQGKSTAALVTPDDETLSPTGELTAEVYSGGWRYLF